MLAWRSNQIVDLLKEHLLDFVRAFQPKHHEVRKLLCPPHQLALAFSVSSTAEVGAIHSHIGDTKCRATRRVRTYPKMTAVQ